MFPSNFNFLDDFNNYDLHIYVIYMYIYVKIHIKLFSFYLAKCFNQKFIKIIHQKLHNEFYKQFDAVSLNNTTFTQQISKIIKTIFKSNQNLETNSSEQSP